MSFGAKCLLSGFLLLSGCPPKEDLRCTGDCDGIHLPKIPHWPDCKPYEVPSNGTCVDLNGGY